MSDTHSVDYFCHVWDYNTWKLNADSSVMHTPYEPVNHDWLENQLLRFAPASYKIDNYSKLYPSKKNMPWVSLFYSMMYSNFLKIQHERYKQRYDFVVKCRYDIVFEPGKKFCPLGKPQDRRIYTGHADRMHYRFNKINASDTIFYGDSWGMDIITDSYFDLIKYHNKSYNRRLDQLAPHDPGTFIYECASKYNVAVDIDARMQGVIYRQEMSGTDAKLDFNKILENHNSYYTYRCDT